MKKYFCQFILFCFFLNFNELLSRINDIKLDNVNKSQIDVTVIGYCLYSDGLGRLPIGFIDSFKNKLTMNFIKSRNIDFDIKENFSKVDLLGIKEVIENKNKTPGNVSILFDALWKDLNREFPTIPDSVINIAYSVFESTQIPTQWANFLNEKFDAVVVPSPFLIKVYQDSGVKVPVFLLPAGVYIDDFLDAPIKNSKNTPFVFACFANFMPHKNQELLLHSFLNVFGDDSSVLLKLYGVGGPTLPKLYEILKKKQVKNVEIVVGHLSPDEYLKAFSSIDCCVVLSKAEGFSVRPREAIALGIPTILSNNTAHESICKTPYFIPVKSTIKEPADYTFIFGDYYGYNFNLVQKDVEEALLKVYNNYDYYLEKANKGREWVKQFTYKSLEKKYLNLLKPNKVIFGPKNLITNDYIMTNCKSLYEKYLFIQSLAK